MRLKEFFSRSDFIKSILTLFTGSAIAQAIPVIISPILTRIFTVEQFAVLAIFTALSSLIGVIATARYEIAITMPENHDEARHLVHLSILITCIVSFITLIAFLLFGDFIAGLFDNPDIVSVLWLVPVFVFFYGLGQSLNYWLLRFKRFKTIAVSRVAQSTSNSTVALVSGIAKTPFNGLVAGNLMGQVSATSFLMYLTKKHTELRFKPSMMSAAGIKKMAQRYSDFPKVNSFQSLVDMFQSVGVIFLLANFFGSIVVGFYGFTIKILQAPLTLLGNSISLVFYKSAAEINEPGASMQFLLKKTWLTLAFIAVPVFSIIYFFGPEIFKVVFGNHWEQAGIYASAISPWLFANFMAAPVSQITMIMKRQPKAFVYSLIGNSLIVAAIFLGIILFNDVESALKLVSLSQVIYYLFLIRFYWLISGKISN